MTTAQDLADRLLGSVVGALEALESAYLPGFHLPGTFAGHAVGADVRADLCFTLTHLAEAGVAEVAGRPVDAVVTGLLGAVDGDGTHSFFSYRIAETLLRAGPFAGNPLVADLDPRQRGQLVRAVDCSSFVPLLRDGGLPRNYAAVLARCEHDRVALGLVEDTTLLDELVARLVDLLGAGPGCAVDDSNDGSGRYDIYSADLWLFCQPLAARLGDRWRAGMQSALDLVATVGARNGAAIAWGRSTGDLAAALTVELAALALATGLVGPDGSRWLRRAAEAATTLDAAFDADGLSTAHVGRDQDGYRGPARRLQLTFDLLGKLAWAATQLQRAIPSVGADTVAAPVANTYRDGEHWVPFEEARPAGVWALRRPGVDLVVPFVGGSASHYLAVPHQPGTWEVAVDRDLPTWAPLAVTGSGRWVAAGVPEAVEVGDGSISARWDGWSRSAAGLGPTVDRLAATRSMRLAVEGRTLVLDERLTFADAPTAVGVAIPEVAGRPLRVEWECATPHAAATVPVTGLSEWRTPWSTLERVHQFDLAPATDLAYRVRVTPLLRLGSTELDHHYSQALYGPMSDRVVAGETPVGWRARPDPGFRGLDVLHLHWPEWLAFDDLAAHRAIIADLADHDIPVVWTAHNLTPHEKRPGVFDAIYQAWAGSVAAVIHHSAWGEERMRARYAFGPDCRHEVIPHGHFGEMWTGERRLTRADAEQRLGLSPAPLRIGVVGAPRQEKLVQAVLDGVAASSRSDVQLVCWSLGPDDVVPDDARIAIAEPYSTVGRGTYATRLAACDVLALVFDPAGEMLATGTAADAIGVGLPALRSEWGYLVEHLGAAGIPVGDTGPSIAAAIDALTPERLTAARAAAAERHAALGWPAIADRTADLLERVVQHLP